MKKIYTEMRDKLSSLRATLFPRGDGEVWLYGSRARGDYKEDSDWDIIIISDKLKDDFINFKRYGMPFVELGIDLDQEVRPILYSRQQWENEKGTLFHYNVLHDRIRL